MGGCGRAKVHSQEAAQNSAFVKDQGLTGPGTGLLILKQSITTWSFAFNTLGEAHVLS